ncbi:MAG: phosphotransferase family protein [Alphaproteobacteria bacterium]|nr:phosphotransferase family protein [Alphaproteobacteria bacterium]
MSEQKPEVLDYGQAGERQLSKFVEELTQGKIIRMERQVRWRPSWYVDVERGDEILRLYLRGQREGDVAIFPDLRREADVISVLGRHGVPVPKIYGYCENPPAIVMDALPGTRDMSQASERERQSIGREYMAAVAAMHRVPVDEFAAVGLDVPEGAENIALAGLRAYWPHYQRTKSKPEPLLEFALGWIKRNVPKHRTKPAFIQFDSGQFLIENGKMTGLYDFEFSMVGDPMTDIATMRMRDSYEPLGDELHVLCRHYEEFSGEPVDHAAVNFHTLLFAVLGTMQFAGTVGVPRNGDPHSVYLEFDVALRQVILLILSDLMGITIVPEQPLRERPGDNAVLIAKLSDAIAQIGTTSELDASRKDAAAQLIECLVRSDAMGQEALARNLADVSALLGQHFDDWYAAEAALEDYVRLMGDKEDERLLRLLAAIEGRRMQILGPTRIGASARHVHLPPTR